MIHRMVLNDTSLLETYMIDCFKWKNVVICFIKTLAGSYVYKVM